MRKTLIAFAAVATAFAVPAAAQDASDTVTITVQTNDLDLASPADQSRLETRIDSAISRVCRSGGRDFDARRAEAACRNSLRDAFAPQVEVAIMEAREEHFAALDLSLRA